MKKIIIRRSHDEKIEMLMDLGRFDRCDGCIDVVIKFMQLSNVVH